MLEKNIQDGDLYSAATAIRRVAVLNYDALRQYASRLADKEHGHDSYENKVSKQQELEEDYLEDGPEFPEDRFQGDGFSPSMYAPMENEPDQTFLEFYATPAAAIPEDFYAATSALPLQDSYVETMTTEEAEETLIEIQYAVVCGGLTELDFRERNRFATWATFEPALRDLFHRSYAMTSEVNYSKVM